MAFFYLKVPMKEIFSFLFKKPSAKEIAKVELEECMRQHLKYEASAAYHSKMTEYYATNIARLNAYVKRAEQATASVTRLKEQA